MKKNYFKPAVEVELYELSDSIASNCNTVVTMGPDGPGYIEICEDYYEITGETPPSTYTLSRSRYNIDFWTEDSCDCYYSASGTFFTS
ncbi:MAG: hypothetical protein ACI4SR_01965 [Faecalibacillus sp.]